MRRWEALGTLIDRVMVRVDGIVEIAARETDETEVVIRVRVRSTALLDGRLVRARRFVELSQREERAPEAPVGARIDGLLRDRRPKLADGLAGPIQVVQRQTETVMRSREITSALFDRRSKRADGVLEPASVAENGAKTEERFRISRILRNGCIEGLDRVGRSSLALSNSADLEIPSA